MCVYCVYFITDGWHVQEYTNLVVHHRYCVCWYSYCTGMFNLFKSWGRGIVIEGRNG